MSSNVAGPSFGAVKQLQKRVPDAAFKACKAALVEADGDEDKAAAALGEVSTGAADQPDEEEPGGTSGAALSTSGPLQVIRIEVGDEETFPEYGDTCHMHYKGFLADALPGALPFDSSYDRKKTFEFRIGMNKVIKGWDVGIAKMSVGEKALLFIPAHMAYGASGNGPVPPNADLKFEVQLLKITRQTSCLGPGQHGNVQRKNHEYADLANQLLGKAPPTTVQHNLPDDRQPMPLTSEMPR
tara:strand:- start:906 stop:1628 length:723 start_codon:yes stop_codon:yes gene_type:complete